jgi:hypothetical protein
MDPNINIWTSMDVQILCFWTNGFHNRRTCPVRQRAPDLPAPWSAASAASKATTSRRATRSVLQLSHRQSRSKEPRISIRNSATRARVREGWQWQPSTRTASREGGLAATTKLAPERKMRLRRRERTKRRRAAPHRDGHRRHAAVKMERTRLAARYASHVREKRAGESLSLPSWLVDRVDVRVEFGFYRRERVLHWGRSHRWPVRCL